MSGAIVRTLIWVGLVNALAFAALYGFLYTPESNVLMLGVSALLVLAAGVVLALSSTAASYALVHGRAPWSSISESARSLPLVFVALLVLGVICGGAGWFETWWMARAGEFDAAAIAAGDITRTGWVHSAVHWMVIAIQWVLVPAWLAAALAWVAGYERRDVLTLKWLTAGLHWKLVAATAAGVVLLVWLPWRYVYWRPRSLPASAVEVVFTGIKLIVIYLLAHLAWTIALWIAARMVHPAASAPVAAPAATPEIPR